MTPISVTEVIKQIRDLPSPPILVAELLSSFEEANLSMAALAEKVSHDQALAAKTLRLANSSFYGLSRKVNTIQQAITILGVDTVRALIVAAGVTEEFQSVMHSSFNVERFWRHSVGTAVCAQQIARVNELSQNYAFVCGLLHDIGKLVLVTRFPIQYQAVLTHREQQDCRMLDAERAVLGIDHTVVGRLLAENWKFPLQMQRAIANHHAPDPQASGDLSSVVHAANIIVHALDLAEEKNDIVPEIDEKAWKGLNLNAADLRQIFRDTEEQFNEACQILVT